MATYNRAHLLPHAIRNIIAQTFRDWELIIVDDASTDNTKEVVHDFIKQDPRIRYHRHQHNSGLAVARNTSFQLAQGAYITFQDDDDLSHIRRLDILNQYLDAHPDTDMVTAGINVFLKHIGFLYKKVKTFHCQKDKPKSLRDLIEVPSPFACYMARKHVFATIQMRPFFRVAEDYDAFLRCSERYTLTALPTVLYHYRAGDHAHKTLSTGDAATRSLCFQYHCLAWSSAVHRRMGWNDPIDKADSITDAIDNLHPQFQTRMRDELKKLVEGFSLPLIQQPERNITEPIYAFLSRFADSESTQHLIDLTIALCLLQNNRQKLSSFTHHKDPLRLERIKKQVRAIPQHLWKEQVDYFIRDNRKHDFANLLRLNRRCQSNKALLPPTNEILSACLQHRRFRLIISLFMNLITVKTS